jgi:hypothetical protein
LKNTHAICPKIILRLQMQPHGSQPCTKPENSRYEL